MEKYLLIVLLLTSLAHNTSAANTKAFVASLPDLPPLLSRWYSGQYNVSSSRQLHYVFVESHHEPEKAPIIVWFGGGPGGSTMTDLLAGIGPFSVDPVTKAGDAAYNPDSLTNKSSVIYLDNPAGVGFSYVSKKADICTNDY
jgi:carboxypeptidase C (cathepsin A)